MLYQLFYKGKMFRVNSGSGFKGLLKFFSYKIKFILFFEKLESIE